MPDSRMVNVLIVDDSEFSRRLIRKLLGTDREIRVIGSAASGSEALQFLQNPPQGIKPDVIIIDILMPGMDGFETTRLIMESNPIPIIIVTNSYNPQDLEKTFRSMEAGAVAIIQKPGRLPKKELEKICKELIAIIKLMADVKVVRRWPRDKAIPPPVENPYEKLLPAPKIKIRILAIGASTGGTIAFQQILLGLSREIPIPIVMVQHIGGEFIPGMIRWLEKTTAFPVHLARGGQKMQPGHVYLAPDDFHMGVQSGNIIEISTDKKIQGLRPSVTYLFRSVAQVYKENAIGVLLTGMGKDGGQGLKEMRDAGAVTIAQDENTSAVFGMPAEGIKLGGAQFILPLKEIPIKIHQILGIELPANKDKVIIPNL